MKNILSEEINHHEQESIEIKKQNKTKKTTNYILNSLKPLDFEIVTYRI